MLVFIMNGVLLFIDYQYVTMNYEDYMYTRNYYIQNNLDMDIDMNQDTYSVVVDGDTTTIENPLLYHYSEMSKALYVISPVYAVAHIEELSIVIFPALFAIIGVFLATYDIKNKVYRHKLQRFGRKLYVQTKMVTGFCLVTAANIFSVITARIMSAFLYSYVCTYVTIEDFAQSSPERLSSDMQKIVIMLLISYTYYSVGLFIGSLTANALVSSVGILAFLYMMPIISKYELINCCRAIMKEFFEFFGLIDINEYKTVSFGVAMGIIIIWILITNLAVFVIVQKKSGDRA